MSTGIAGGCLFNKASGGTGFTVPPLCFFGGCRSLLSVWFGLDGVICSMPASDILAAVISVVLIKKRTVSSVRANPALPFLSKRDNMLLYGV